ncbi:outer membrane lipoprotein carrier protein LolA [Dissulfurirhabdus thermomarina]|uniref:Outer membrane lipoprotein carrier protein LolA n=1 Tax=Dissulfurirhabdus thermomarina TaxID=1765737 RepID=A0A6N9TMS5_DISTH|nr:outer membrane lipoprotein carrier protein LolA [Dissulfurirhabdus thermomarina]NDY42358.1 outer membrane lipoprotein carrier protein LolA [Dissulfurirhabdus thermomarina]NMX23014.1 outer membrane lipoprotein carrier protein LolA [Dissulfurirhabdus thermomarina]
MRNDGIRLHGLAAGLALLALAAAGPAAAGPLPGADRLAALLQERYDETRTLSAAFRQETWPAGASRPVTAEGRVFFKRPDRMRWEYTAPERRLIVTEGADVFIYEPEAGQVLVLPRAEFLSSEVSRAFFFGKGRLADHFAIAPAAPDRPRADWTLRLTPRSPAAGAQRLWITLDPASHLIQEVWLEDALGGRTHIVFSGMDVNRRLDDGLFRFTPPDGVPVYRTGAP